MRCLNFLLYCCLFYIAKCQVDNCAAPNDAGLKNLLKEARNLFPLERMNRILVNAGNDNQVSALRQLRSSQDFIGKVAALKQSRAYIAMSNYSCGVMHLNLKYYREFVKEPLNFNSNASATDATGRPGIAGMLQDLREVLPQARLQANYRSLLASDAFLVQGVNSLKSPEFRALLSKVRSQQVFQDLRAMMLSVGVPMPEVKRLFDAALGWDGDEFFGDEFMIMKA